MKLFPKSPHRAVPRPQVRVIDFDVHFCLFGIINHAPVGAGWCALFRQTEVYEFHSSSSLCPQNKCQASVFDVMNSSCYEIVMVVLICLNVVVLMVESMDTSHTVHDALYRMQFIFMVIFLLECVFKVTAFRQHYFKDGWNVVDFVVLLIQIAGKF